ncbi:MAG TPA: class II fructose-bisphosphatase [Anaerolineales bacterium]|nr:class II fructose-bisphosphatase [Anaerolineales bacterium]
MSAEKPDHNIALELTRVTEAAALAAGRFMGRGDKIAADRAAVDAMRLVLNSLDINGKIVIGEGEKDNAPMLHNGENLGSGSGIQLDLAVDPIDGTSLISNGRANALAIVAAAEANTLFSPGPFYYMSKIAVGPSAKGAIDIEAPPSANLRWVARAKGCDVQDLTVVILDRPRHEKLIGEVRKAGARIRLVGDGDVAGALMTARTESGIDILMGVGGTPEGVLAACALKCLGGEIQGKLVPRNDAELRVGLELGYDPNQVLTLDDFVKGDNIFFAATGITDGELLDGVKYYGNGARTQSLVMRSKSGTVRWITAHHRLDKLNQYSSVSF